MSVREEDRQKNSCSSRGLGIAAAAIGVGVGAALYYLFNKRQENPTGEGSTSDWNCEPIQTFLSDDSYTTISENETSDTSINSTNTSFSEHSLESSSEESDSDESGTDSFSDEDSSDSTFETGYLTVQNALSTVLNTISDTEWDITTSSVGVPEDRSRSPLQMLIGRIGYIISPRKKKTEEEQMTILRQQAFRERSWTLEECSICFDVMLRTQEVTSLPCSHNFHTECIMPWLQEKQTCPNCRKVAE